MVILNLFYRHSVSASHVPLINISVKKEKRGDGERVGRGWGGGGGGGEAGGASYMNKTV